MSYNLQSLITILEQILNPQQTCWILDDHNKSELESFLEKAASLQQILENSSIPKIQTLETQIREAAHKAEDIIESHMVDQMSSTPGGVSFIFSTPDLIHVRQELDSAMEQVVKLVEGKRILSGSSSSGASFSSSKKSFLVGVDEDLLHLKDRLTGTQSKLEIVPIVGMGGVGKTTLARKLYEDTLIVSHFTCLAWTTISQDYNMKAILSGLLRCIIGKHFDQHIGKQNDELKDILYKSLYGRKYMIVLDDIWNTKFWDEIRRYFPDNNNGSRIVMTTRESDVAKYADSQSQQHQVQLLSKSESWDLLRQIVFGEEDCCDHVLQGIGEKMASDCGGLPLAINVIGGLLSKLQRSNDVWEHIANDVGAAIAESDTQFFDILCLSYNHLPNHLKPCFLYMGAFPEDYEIKGSRLMRLWVAEGFLKSNGVKSMEEEAEDCLKALVERNLVLVKDYKYNGKAKRYSMHDLLRDLCMKKADEERFLNVINGAEVTFCNPRRVSYHTTYEMEDVCASATRSFIRTGYLSRSILSRAFFVLRLLRVLDVLEIYFEQFPKEIFQLVNLRFLAFSYTSLSNSGTLPSGISRLSNLQILICKGWFKLPSEIWEMRELRHFKWDYRIKLEDEYVKRIVQKKLQTISTVALTRSLLRMGFFECIPNINKLEIIAEVEPSRTVDLSHLHKLETLKCGAGRQQVGCCYLRTLIFPTSLRKLTLSCCVIFRRVLTALHALPNLEVLNMEMCVFVNDEEWEVREGEEFRSLQFLRLKYMKLVRWKADETNFPRLRHLILDHCRELEEIPSGIGEIATLQLMELNKCSASAVASAQQIQEVQQSEYDNYALQLRITDEW